MTTNTIPAISYTEASLVSLIEKVAKAERVTKEGLAELSYSLLHKWHHDQDPTLINMLLGKDRQGRYMLTPLNHRIAIQYFQHFVGASSNWDEVKDYAIKGGNRKELVFGVKTKNAQKRTFERRESWLSSTDNNIWEWSKEAKMEAKPVDLADRVTKSVKKALEGDEKNGIDPLSIDVVLDAVLAAGVSVDDLFKVLHSEEKAA
jgi:hypothetical protein